MSSRLSRLSSLLCFLVVCLHYELVAAQDKAVASQLFDSAVELMAAGKLSQACPRFAESQRLDPQLGTLLHLAECQDAQGKMASAWASFKDAVEIAAQRGDGREAKIRQRLLELDGRVPRLTVAVPGTPADLEIRRNGIVMGKPVWGVSVPVDPGDYEIVAAASGHESWAQQVHLSPGMHVTVDVPVLNVASAAAALASAAPRGAAVAPSAAVALLPNDESAGLQSAPDDQAAPVGQNDPEQPHQPSKVRKVLGWSVLVAGVLGLGLGTGFEVLSISQLNERNAICPSGIGCESGSQARIDRITDDARSARLIGTIGLVAGGVLAIAGVTLLLTAPNSDSQAPHVDLSFTPQGVSLSGRL